MCVCVFVCTCVCVYVYWCLCMCEGVVYFVFLCLFMNTIDEQHAYTVLMYTW